MKKLITICLLVVTLLVGGMTMDAKTTQKPKATSGKTSKKSSGSFSVKSFMKDTGRGYNLKSLNQIKSTLTSNGYKYAKTERTQVSGLNANAYIFNDSKGNEVVVVAISDSSIGVVDDVNEITFKFINSAERDKFTKGKTSDFYGVHDQVQLKVTGNIVKLEDDCYYC